MRGASLAVLIGLVTLASCEAEQIPPEREASHGPFPFAEIAASVGLDFQHFVGATGEYLLPEVSGSGVAVIDYDGDGDLDVYLIQSTMADPEKSFADSLFPTPSEHWPGNRFFRNELVETGELRFVDVTDAVGLGHEGFGMGVAVGDYDNDGDPDLYVTNLGSNVFYRNEGDGTFVDVTAETATDDDRWSSSAAFVDYDHDGLLDLFVANYVYFTPSDNKPCDGTGGRDYCGPNVYDPTPDSLFRNLGDGRFANVTAQAGIDAAFGSGLGVTCSDLDGDGWVDIYVANDGDPNQLWHNKGDGTFEDVSLFSGTAYNADGVAEAGMGVTAADFDNDGDDDLFMTHLDMETNTLYVNEGSNRFRDETNRYKLGQSSFRFTGFGTQWFDFDNDGFLDLFIANGAVNGEEHLRGEPYPYHQLNQLYRNRDGVEFVELTASAGPPFALSEVSRGAAFGDLDNDGDIDIVGSNNNGPARLFRNEVGNRTPWLQVRLRGTESPRDANGAKVAVLREGEPILWRQSHTDSSYLSANDSRVHFGLGANPVIDAVVVKWTSGRQEMWKDISAGGVVSLTEGTGTPWSGAEGG